MSRPVSFFDEIGGVCGVVVGVRVTGTVRPDDRCQFALGIGVGGMAPQVNRVVEYDVPGILNLLSIVWDQNEGGKEGTKKRLEFLRPSRLLLRTMNI